MRTCFWAIGVVAIAVSVGSADGQTLQRRANAVGGGSPDRGKCTVEVFVDGAAEVEIRGDNATLRNLSGQSAQWRRFECTSALPANPQNFRFTGMDGRGSQELVRSPQNGGVAVVRIQDPEGGAEGYTFDLTWGVNDRQTYPDTPERGDPNQGRGMPQPPQGPGGYDGRDRRGGQRYTTEQAVRVCQEAVRQQAYDRFHNEHIAFRRTALDDTPGRQDWVTGLFDMRRGYDRDETYRFSCSVNFDNGEVRSAQIDPIDRDRYMSPGYGGGRGSSGRQGLESCQRSVEANIRQKGYQHIDFLSVNVDDRPGRSDWIVGTARADVRLRSDTFSFSCSVDLRDGDVRSVDVRRSWGR